MNILRRSVMSAVAVVLLSISACSLSDPEGEPGKLEIPEYPEAVSGVGWEWRAPEGTEITVLPIPVGVAVLDGEGVTALSGTTGEELWEHHEPGGEVVGRVSDDGDRLSLHVEDSEEGRVRMLLLDAVTGELLTEALFEPDEESTADLRDSSTPVRGALNSSTEDLWFVREGDTVYARDLEQGDERWSVSLGEECEDQGSVGDMAIVEGAVVVSSTCHGGEDELYVESADFSSRLIALDAESGEELWRDEGRYGLFPAASIERSLTVYSSHLVAARTEVGESTQWVDASTWRSGTIEDGGLRWVDSAGERFGVWDSAQRDYRIQDRDGNVERSLREGPVGSAEMIGNALRPAPDAYVADGVLFLVDQVDAGAGEDLLGVFEGFGGTVDIALDGGADREFQEAILAPGAIAVPYVDGDGRSGVLGLS
ncbi:PQQ-binding-like beta-propeller repeat protein [Nocardiopsis alba]|uniref:outer membrane protein assembly factor BamB family protein n=1 Tax=Nocardiopsis alba TaxID=53437 RepID=UPI00366BA759